MRDSKIEIESKTKPQQW